MRSKGGNALPLILEAAMTSRERMQMQSKDIDKRTQVLRIEFDPRGDTGLNSARPKPQACPPPLAKRLHKWNVGVGEALICLQ